MTSAATLTPRAQPLRQGQLSHLKALLDAERLPSADLDEPDVRLFAFHDGGEIVAYAGLELYGGDALLRSVVVIPARRRGGMGKAVVEATLAEARSLGAARAFLLTTTAKAYFERLGFLTIDRGAAPETILSTRQAASLCPSSAPVMVRALA